MNNTNWDTFKCRCSAIGKIMADSRSNPTITEKQKLRLIELEARESLTPPMAKEIADLLLKQENSTKVILSDTAIEYLMEVYAWETEGMIAVDKEVLDIWQIKKGKEVEKDSIKLISIIDGVEYKKNDLRVSNEFLIGEPDVFVGTDIYKASKISDVKSLWDFPTFLKSINKAAENGYTDQINGYCDITGATEGEIARCLVSMSDEMITEWRRKLSFKGGYVSDESLEFLEKWKPIEHSMKFDHIPVHKRVFKLPIAPFTPERRQMVYDRVKICREWLWKFDEQYKILNLN